MVKVAQEANKRIWSILMHRKIKIFGNWFFSCQFKKQIPEILLKIYLTDLLNSKTEKEAKPIVVVWWGAFKTSFWKELALLGSLEWRRSSIFFAYSFRRYELWTRLFQDTYLTSCEVKSARQNTNPILKKKNYFFTRFEKKWKLFMHNGTKLRFWFHITKMWIVKENDQHIWILAPKMINQKIIILISSIYIESKYRFFASKFKYFVDFSPFKCAVLARKLILVFRQNGIFGQIFEFYPSVQYLQKGHLANNKVI